MTATEESRVQFADGEVITPKLRSTARRSIFWIVLTVLVVLFAIVSLLTVGVQTSTARLSATNLKPNGAAALISVLRQDGVQVTAPRTLATAIKDASADVPETTVVLYDPTRILDTDQLGNLGQVAPNLVIIEPSARMLSTLVPGVTLGGLVATTAHADCGFGPVRRAGTVTGLAAGYSAAASSGVDRCLGSFGDYSLIRSNYSNQTVTVVGTTTAFTNESIATAGNAALALGLFGSTKHLVWYRPSFADHATTGPDGVLPAPPWVPLLAALVALVAIAAAVWRGRRLGPMVVERMPVTVRASETLEGRARLYQRASARGHALDLLRMGSIARLAKLCGLPHLATVDDVIGAVCSVTGRPEPAVRALLLDDAPATDAQLVRLSDDLRRLEKDVAEGVTPR
jgi:hypothetical protein